MTGQRPLFGDCVVEAPTTEGIKYAGSKLRLLPRILELVAKTGAQTVLDGFSGTTRVSQALAKTGCSVVCNDVAVWSEVFGTCFLRATKSRAAYQSLIDHLNSIPPAHGWFTENYGGEANDGCAVQADGRKRPWQGHNTRKLDGIRLEIEALKLDKVDEAVALTSLVLAMDRVDSTLGHYASYLHDWSPRSYNSITLTVPDIVRSRGAHRVSRRDVFEVVDDPSVDLCYFDPPYGSNNEKMPSSRVRYAAYYHLWASVCLFDKPALFGKAGRRADSSDVLVSSPFEDFRQDAAGGFVAVNAIDRLLAAARSRWIILSYSSGGRATASDLEAAIRRNGRLREVVELDHKRNVMADMKWTNDWLRDAEAPNREFLFLIER